MKPDLLRFIAQVAAERQLPRASVATVLEDALAEVYRRKSGETRPLRVSIDEQSGDVTVLVRTGAASDSSEETSVIHPEDLGRMLGRIAAFSTRANVAQRLREIENRIQGERFRERVGALVRGTIKYTDEHGCVIVDLGDAVAILPRREQITGETYAAGRTLRAVIGDVQFPDRNLTIVLSRATPQFVRALFEEEVPEIAMGEVEIRGIARIPGIRTKIAVSSHGKHQAVAVCIGTGGSRIQAVQDELGAHLPRNRGRAGRESIDVIRWSEDPCDFIADTLRIPVRPQVSLLGERKARVEVPASHLHMAIGRHGHNTELTQQLTGWHIDIVATPETARVDQGAVADTSGVDGSAVGEPA